MPTGPAASGAHGGSQRTIGAVAFRTIEVALHANTTAFRAQMGVAARSTKEFAQELAAADSKNRAVFDKLGKGALIAGGAVAVGFGIAVGAAANFDSAMSEVGAVANATADDMGLLRQAALDAGAATSFSASEAAQAQAELVKAGVSVQDVLGGGLTGTLDLAAAGSLDLAQAATIAAQAMNIFELRGSDVTHIADLLAAGANKSAADVAQLGDAMRQGGLVASQTGLSIEETVGALSAFADRALVGSDAGTAFKTMLQRLTPQSVEARNLMDELGFSAYDAQGNFIGLEGLARELQDSLAGMTVEQRNATMATLFGSDAVRGANVLYELGAEGVREYTEAVDDQGAAADMAAKKLDNLSGDLEELSGSVETALIEGGSKATGVLRFMAQSATDVVNGFTQMPDSLQTVTIGMTGVAGAASLAVGGFITLAPKISAAKDALTKMDSAAGKFLGRNMGTLTGVAAGLGVAVVAGTLAYEAATRSSREYDAQVKELASSLKPVLEGQTSLNEALGDFLKLQTQGLSNEAIDGMNALGVSIDDVEAAVVAGRDALDPFREAVAALGIDMEGLDFGKIGDKGSLVEPAERLADALGISKEALDQLSNELEDWDNEAQGAAKRTLDLAVNNDELTQSQVDAAIAAHTLADGTVNYAGALDYLAGSLPGAKDGVDEVTTGLNDQEQAAEDVTKAIKDYQDALRAGVDPVFAMADAVRGNQQAQNAYSEALAKNNDAIEDNNVTQAELDSLLQDAAGSALDMEVAASDLETAMLNGKVSAEGFREQLDRWVTQGTITKEQADLLAWSFGITADQADRIDGDRTASLHVQGQGEVEAVLGRVEAQMARIVWSRTVRLNIQVNNPYATVPGFQVFAGGVQGSTGGHVSYTGIDPIYRARGGPAGTDTIPAWLTPGEFVIHKSAADALGAPLLHRLNEADRRPVMAFAGGGAVPDRALPDYRMGVARASWGAAPPVIVHVESPVYLDGRKIGSSRSVIEGMDAVRRVAARNRGDR